MKQNEKVTRRVNGKERAIGWKSVRRIEAERFSKRGSKDKAMNGKITK